MSLAIRIHEFGASDVLVSEEIPTPEPGPGEVRIRVYAASVNPVDYKIRKGVYPMVSTADLPMTMGRDVSGVVDAVGEGVGSFDRGALVHAMISKGGGYAQHAIVNAGDAATVPEGLGHEQAAAIPLAGLTAWQALVDHGRLREAQSVLVHGGAGGVGHFAIQIAKARGARVFATATAEDATLLRELGADTIDYRNQHFEDEIDEVDLVLDLVGGETQERSWAVLKSGGAMISTLEEPSEEAAREKNAHTARFTVEPNGTQLEELGRLVLKGQLRPIVSEVLPLERASEAQDKLEQKHIQGKIVLTVP